MTGFAVWLRLVMSPVWSDWLWLAGGLGETWRGCAVEALRWLVLGLGLVGTAWLTAEAMRRSPE